MATLGESLYGQSRKDRLINFDWKFIQKSIENAYLESYDDKNWELVHLPHDASISGPFVNDSLNSDRKNGFRPRLKGWYRKSLNIADISSTKRYFLKFEGVYRDAKVYFNEEKVAHQLNGYEEFEIDITKQIRQGENLIAVSYDNTDMTSSRWYNGEGIYRDVWLKVRSDAYVIDNGTYITTPLITDDLAKINIKTEVLNDGDNTRHLLLKSEILDKDGKVLTEVSNTVPIAAGELYTFDQNTVINTPYRWSLKSPNLYKVRSTVIFEGMVIDQLLTRFGIRTVEFNPGKGFLLNGKKLLVKGVNIHHDLGPLGAAAFERGFERRLEGLKKLGCNAIRLSHNPHDKFILDWCDENGMLIYDEAFDKWDDQFFGNGNKFENHWRSSLESFIRRDRNHPSIFLWSVGNETHQQRDAGADFGVPQMKKMTDLVHKLEPTRLVTCGLHPSRARGTYRTDNYYREGPPEIVFYMDVVSTNYREEFWPIDRANYPQLTFILSEAQVGNFGNEWFNFNHDYSVGLFYWGGTDYLGESFGWPAKGWPNGIIDWNDHWKPFSYYIHSLFTEEPTVYIAAYDPSQETQKYWNEVNLRYQPLFSHWNWNGKDSVRLMTFSNAEEVELFLNGQSLGIKKVPQEYATKDIKAYSADEYDPENPINTGPEIHKRLEWVIPYAKGTIRAVSKINGKQVAEYEIKTAGDPYRIELEADRSVISADGLDLSYITIKVVDRQGVIIPDADHKIKIELSGHGTIAGMGSADVLSNQPFDSNERKVFQGKALLVVRARRSEGEIRVKATANGLKGSTILLKTFE